MFSLNQPRGLFSHENESRSSETHTALDLKAEDPLGPPNLSANDATSSSPEFVADGPNVGGAADPLSINRLASLYVKRSKAAEESQQWDLALEDANKAIGLEPLSPLAHERREAVYYARMEHDNSVLRTRDEKRNAIRESIRDVIKDWPPLLINTQTGRTCDRQQQELAFEDLSPFKEYISSDTRTTPQVRKSLVAEMKRCCRYIMLSHAWKGSSSVFVDLREQSLYEMTSPDHVTELRHFCDVVREAGCYWAWSDTTCFRDVWDWDAHEGEYVRRTPSCLYGWYSRAWRTIVLLHHPSLPISVKNSVWITRSWTIQEYVAARFVWFYTIDWRPYHNLGTFNHKYSSIVVAEVQEATKISAETLHKLQPGLVSVREKLQLAAPRHVSRAEDTAYSLLRLFDIDMPRNYGEGTESAVGRLLEQIITRSGDVVVLDWTGIPGPYNSCLPCDLRPFGTAQYHVPSPVFEIPAYFPELDTSSILLYKRLVALEPPRMTNTRLRLPCIAFRVQLQVASDGVYRMQIRGLRDVEVQTMDDLSTMSKNLVLVHPWIRALLDSSAPPTGVTLEGGVNSHPSDISKIGAETCLAGDSSKARTTGLQLAARLRQEFGGLLLSEGSSKEYRRVAADTSIRVQLLENTSFSQLLENVCVLDVV